MKRLLITSLTLIIGFCALSQEKQTLDEIKRQAIEIDSLKKVIKEQNQTFNNYKSISSTNIRMLSDSVKLLNTKLTYYQKFKAERKEYEKRIQSFEAMLVSLNQQLSAQKDTNKAILDRMSHRVINERRIGKEEALTSIINTYLSKSFDEILKEKTLASVVQDSEILGTNSSVSKVVTFVRFYFEAQSCLRAPYSEGSVTKALNKLHSISVDSEYVSNLKNLLENYHYYYEDFKKTIDNLVKIDKAEIVDGMPEEIVEKKSYKVLSIISNYIFSYDFNLNDYPYITEQLLEVLKIKIKNPDASLQAITEKLK